MEGEGKITEVGIEGEDGVKGLIGGIREVEEEGDEEKGNEGLLTKKGR